ncbi:MAG: hypothetical protein HYV54_02185 [Parcubacteria group bacterium]|nr:hypothetical protein [Parcubacteria group bacterium]
MEFISWGVKYSSDIPHSADLRCLECRWSLARVESSERFIVGFSTDGSLMKIPFFGVGKIVGGIIIECPECFSKFWFHVSEDLADIFRMTLPQWPKPPNPNAE